MSVDTQVLANQNISLTSPETAARTRDTRSRRRRRAAVESPLVMLRGDVRVLFGPGVDDFNEFDDPC